LNLSRRNDESWSRSAPRPNSRSGRTWGAEGASGWFSVRPTWFGTKKSLGGWHQYFGRRARSKLPSSERPREHQRPPARIRAPHDRGSLDPAAASQAEGTPRHTCPLKPRYIPHVGGVVGGAGTHGGWRRPHPLTACQGTLEERSLKNAQPTWNFVVRRSAPGLRASGRPRLFPADCVSPAGGCRGLVASRRERHRFGWPYHALCATEPSPPCRPGKLGIRLSMAWMITLPPRLDVQTDRAACHHLGSLASIRRGSIGVRDNKSLGGMMGVRSLRCSSNTTLRVSPCSRGRAVATAGVDLNTWQHIAVVFAPDRLEFYKNGNRFAIYQGFRRPTHGEPPQHWS